MTSGTNDTVVLLKIWCAENYIFLYYIFLDFFVALSNQSLNGQIPKCNASSLKMVQLG